MAKLDINQVPPELLRRFAESYLRCAGVYDEDGVYMDDYQAECDTFDAVYDELKKAVNVPE